MGQVRLPVLPVNEVLFPGGSMNVRLSDDFSFGLVRDAIADRMPLGVVLLRGVRPDLSGDLCPVGTAARIEGVDLGLDGHLTANLRGERRFGISRVMSRDPYPVADASWYGSEPAVDWMGGAVVADVVRAYAEVVAERLGFEWLPDLDSQLPQRTPERIYAVCAALDIWPSEKQSLLEIPSWRECAERVLQLLALRGGGCDCSGGSGHAAVETRALLTHVCSLN